MPKEDNEQYGYRQHVNVIEQMKSALRYLQAQGGRRRKKAEPILNAIDQIYGALDDAGLTSEFEGEWEDLKEKHGHRQLNDGDKIEDEFYHEFQRLIQRYIYKPEMGLGLSKNVNNQADVSPPLRWGDRVRKRKLGGEFVNVDREEQG